MTWKRRPGAPFPGAPPPSTPLRWRPSTTTSWPRGWRNGAGLSRGLAPTFFLGELLEARQVGELTILVLGPELARDLDASPALCQGTLIYARRQALAFYLWDHLSTPPSRATPTCNSP